MDHSATAEGEPLRTPESNGDAHTPNGVKETNGTANMAEKERFVVDFRPNLSAMEVEESSSEASEDRDTWGSHREYLLSMIGFCVGIGNLWRFPYVCIRNGGGKGNTLGCE